MFDFVMIATRSTKKDVIEVYPKFIIKKSNDLMIQGRDFYAAWIEERGMWSTDEQDVLRIIDRELDRYAEENREKFTAHLKVLHMWDAESRMIEKWHRYCQKDMRDSFHMLDEKLIFSNTDVKKEDYASKKLDYPLQEGPIEAYERIMSTLYSPEERRKIEWAIGSIVSGDSKDIQKFMVLYGAAGTGKSTVLNIIQKLFKGYYSVFDAKSLGSTNAQFALEAFKSNPLVAIQHDGDLSRIEDNTRLNSLVSHEMMTVNEKFKATYANRFKCFLFMGTNKPVKITDAKSGLIRRLIDVSPSGNKLGFDEYMRCTSQIDFELGAIAYHCLKVYQENPNYYNNYIPITMLGASNDFYNFVLDAYYIFKKDDVTTLNTAWAMYKEYCNDANVLYPYSKMKFKEELKNYFKEYYERKTLKDGTRQRNVYFGFKDDKFNDYEEPSGGVEETRYVLDLKSQKSIFDELYSECPAQYGDEDGTPKYKWDNVTTTLNDISTSKLHYVRVPRNHIVIDLDIRDETGEKNLDLNVHAAERWPKTYAEVSKSGKGIHLHYIYDGDPERLSSLFSENVEIKKFTGNGSLRRKLTLCNDIPIATISSGLPLKGEKKVVNNNRVKSERGLREQIIRNLNKEIWPSTSQSINLIHEILENAYKDGFEYDVTDMRKAVLGFAANASNQSKRCIKVVGDMKFKSKEEDRSEMTPYEENSKRIFFDIEVFPNLVLICWKYEGVDGIHRMFNPTPYEVEGLIRHRLVGYNNRRYDNHIVYGILVGDDTLQSYKRSQRIISGDKDAFIREAYNVSETDIYDFASAGNKKSLKKLEIEMGIHHQELGLAWDKPVPQNMWEKVAEYCDNDVIATEAAFNYLKADFTAREILADLTGLTVNDTTNTHTTRLIFGNNRSPQQEFQYRNLALEPKDIPPSVSDFLKSACPDMEEMPSFPGYLFDHGKSTYRGEEVGEGGYVYAEPGIHYNVALLDVSSMHPHSIIAECLFGPRYTKIFKDLVDARVAIKHEDWAVAEGMLNGKLVPYIEKVKAGDMTSKDLANALKTAINSVYGLTSASFTNPFNDPRNKDNIVAKRGALFMIDLKHAVQEQGFTVAHIKTDSIKIPGATPEIIEFVMEYGKRYGYSFEHEATYDRMCLVNNAVYIAKYAEPDICEKQYGYVPGDNRKKGGKWTATGTQFQVPYVFKSLFSKEPIMFKDKCETKSVTSALYLDMNEDMPQMDPNDEKEYLEIQKALAAESPEPLDELTEHLGYSKEEMVSRIAELGEAYGMAHNYIFVGRVGQFCPILPGCGGGLLMREKDGKYYAATGSKGYRWLESEMVRELGRDNDIDDSYFRKMVDDAVDAITKYGDFNEFIEG